MKSGWLPGFKLIFKVGLIYAGIRAAAAFGADLDQGVAWVVNKVKGIGAGTAGRAA